MSLLSITREQCTQDGICIATCPFRLLIRGAEGFPELRPAAEKLCLHCGHCLAACPTGALSLRGIAATDCQELRPDRQPTAEMLAQLLMSRRSMRAYAATPVPQELVARIIDTTRWAPSARNRQPCQWLIISTPATIRQLAELAVEWLVVSHNYPGIVAAWKQGEDLVLRGAPHLALVHARQDGLKPEIDCAIAMTYFELAATSHGLGACWAGILMNAAQAHEPLRLALQLPAGHRLYAALMFGYPSIDYARIPPRRPALVTWR